MSRCSTRTLPNPVALKRQCPELSQLLPPLVPAERVFCLKFGDIASIFDERQ